MPSDDLPVSKASGRYIKSGGRQNAEHFLKMPSDDLPVSRASGRYMKSGGKQMTGILVTGHGHFATGIGSAVKLILGEQENFVTLDFPEGDTKTELEANMKAALEQLKSAEHILVFCDLLSGSPFNTIVPLAMADGRMRVFYGTNLGMLIEVTMNRNLGSSFEELLEDIVKTGREQVGAFSSEQTENSDGDDDWD